MQMQEYDDSSIRLPCGRCIGCRLDRSREWAIRCHHEAMLHETSSFITLTYAEEPPGGGLVRSDFQGFMKRLRKRLSPEKVRYYMCGEYGAVYDERGIKIPGVLGRPHYHAILFGHDFGDREFHKNSRTGYRIYISPTLTEAWGHGHAVTQDFSLECAAYVARYVTKKITGDAAAEHYIKVDTSTGEMYQVPAEFTGMSLKPGIGAGWMERYKGDCYPKDFVTAAGVRFRPPRYYDKILEASDPEVFEDIRERRREAVQDVSFDRLKAMEAVKLRQAEKLERAL